MEDEQNNGLDKKKMKIKAKIHGDPVVDTDFK